MNAPPTRPGALTQAEIDKLLEGLVQRGARVEMKDPRVTSAQNWLLGVIGSALVAGTGYGISTMNELSRNVALLVQQNGFKDKVDAAQDKHMESQDKHMESIDATTQEHDKRLRDLEAIRAREQHR